MKLTKTNYLNNKNINSAGMTANKYKFGNKISDYILWCLTAITFLGLIKTIFISWDIDEGYAVAQAYRLVQGDKLLLDMWEPHQLSAYLPAFFMKIFIYVTGSTDYIVIYLRVIGIIIHAALGFWLYKTACNYVGRKESMLLNLLHVNFLAKWVQIPEFELMNYWYLLLVFLCFLTYYNISKKKIYLVISGICMMLQICNYPTMIFLYPFYMVGMFVQERNHSGRIPIKDMVITTASAVIPGLVFVGYLFSYMDWKTFVNAVSHVMSDPSHTQQTLLEKFGDFGCDTALDIGKSLLLFGIIFGVVYVISKRYFRDIKIKNIILVSFLTETIVYCAGMCFGCLFGDQNQFYLQIRYLIIAVTGVFIYFVYQRKEGVIYWFGIIPGFIAMIAALFVTNMTINVGYSKLFICSISTFLLLFMTLKENGTMGYGMKIISGLGYVAVLVSLILCRILLIRVTSCLPVTINADLAQVTNGPLKGIYMVERNAKTINRNSLLISEYVDAEDNFLYFGCEDILYLCTDAQISAASVQGTSVFNEDFLEYLEEHPEKYPTVIAVDKNFRSDYYRVYNPYNYIMADWIEYEFEYTEKIETDDMILYIR